MNAAIEFFKLVNHEFLLTKFKLQLPPIDALLAQLLYATLATSSSAVFNNSNDSGLPYDILITPVTSKKTDEHDRIPLSIILIL